MDEKHILKYRIIESSSEDPDNPLHELMRGNEISYKDFLNDVLKFS